MNKKDCKKRKAYRQWALRIEENVKEIYNYDSQCIEFLQKYDIAEKGFK